MDPSDDASDETSSDEVGQSRTDGTFCGDGRRVDVGCVAVELDEVSIWFTRISEIALAQFWMLAGEYGIEQDANPVSALALSTVDSQGNPL